MAMAQHIGLQELRRVSSGERAEDQVLAGISDASVEEQNVDEEWQPSRRYQTVLLAAGFAMIFHVIGINSIYGIFQVGPSVLLS